MANQLSPSASLLSEAGKNIDRGKTIVYGLNDGSLATLLSRRLPTGNLSIRSIDNVSLERTKSMLEKNDAPAVNFSTSIFLPEQQLGTYDYVFMEQPKGRKLARRWLIEAFHALKPEGILFLAGDNKLGIKTSILDADMLFKSSAIIGYKKGNRLARFVKSDTTSQIPSWAHEPGVAPGTLYSFQYNWHDQTIDFYSVPGIFAFDKVDAGTEMLIHSLPDVKCQAMLDLGCGYGIIGLIGGLSGAHTVDLIDSNYWAIEAATKNTQPYQNATYQLFQSDVTAAVTGKQYDIVATNPPFHTGRSNDYQVAHAFITQAFSVLRPGGKLLLVANTFLKYKSLIESNFQDVTTITADNRYCVYLATKSITTPYHREKRSHI